MLRSHNGWYLWQSIYLYTHETPCIMHTMGEGRGCGGNIPNAHSDHHVTTSKASQIPPAQ